MGELKTSVRSCNRKSTSEAHAPETRRQATHKDVSKELWRQIKRLFYTFEN